MLPNHMAQFARERIINFTLRHNFSDYLISYESKSETAPTNVGLNVFIRPPKTSPRAFVPGAIFSELPNVCAKK